MMTEALAGGIWTGVGIYLSLGFFVALLYVLGGAGRIDPAARGKGLPWRVRVMLLPGLMVLWPTMLVKLFIQTRPPIQ